MSAQHRYYTWTVAAAGALILIGPVQVEDMCRDLPTDEPCIEFRLESGGGERPRGDVAIEDGRVYASASSTGTETIRIGDWFRLAGEDEEDD